MDLSGKDLCIKCNEGGNLLVCSENGCPLALHEGCTSCRARFDDAGRYYCPYCCYKKAVAEIHKATEYALAEKKALLLFLDENENFSKAKCDQSLQPQNEENVGNAEDPITSAVETIQEEQGEIPSPSANYEDPPEAVSAHKTVGRDSEAASAQASPTETKRRKHSEKSQLKIGKHKKIFWTEAEVNALEAGVAKFSKEPNLNIPWKRILHLGGKLFNAYRTPSDLRDKWRRMHPTAAGRSCKICQRSKRKYPLEEEPRV